MSLWIPRRDKTGRLVYMVVEVPIALIMLAFGISVALLMTRLTTAPVQTLLFLSAMTVFGFVLFAIAKLSRILRGSYVSFGSAGMTAKMRFIYRLGWVLMVAGTTLTVFCIWFTWQS